MKIDYHNLYTHLILITKNRNPCITELNRDRIEKYITGIAANHRSKLYSIFANPEHVHMLISRSPRISETELATRIADSSSIFINQNKLSQRIFEWQDSASAFSVSKKDVDQVCKYILNQEEHHRKISFAEEYDALIKYHQQTLKFGLR